MFVYNSGSGHYPSYYSYKEDIMSRRTFLGHTMFHVLTQESPYKCDYQIVTVIEQWMYSSVMVFCGAAKALHVARRYFLDEEFCFELLHDPQT